jgi:outer membrane lipoprotein carrier protein
VRDSSTGKWRVRVAVLLVAAGCAAGAAVLAATGKEEPGREETIAVLTANDPALEKLLRAFDEAQRTTTTLVAEFTEEKRLKLLEKPVISKGELYFNRPNQVRWEYTSPDRKVFVITEDRYVAYYPALKRAEEVPIRKFVGKRLFRFIGLGQSIDDLGKSYHFRLDTTDTTPGTQLLVLTPRKKKVRDRMVDLRIWVDSTTHLPKRLQYRETDGDTTTLEFRDLRPNVAVAAGHFRIDLPKDVVVSDTFNGFSLGEQSF